LIDDDLGSQHRDECPTVTPPRVLRRLRKEVVEANARLATQSLVILAFGNASAIDREAGLLAIKPSGVPVGSLEVDDVVVVSLEDGRIVAGRLRPSSDTPTHLAIARAFDTVGGIVHTHSPEATAWAQAARPIPCFGTTHADHFAGEVPLARWLTEDEIGGDYEAAVGTAIVDTFDEGSYDPEATPGALVPGHGPFAWGPTAAAAVDNAVALEYVARIARSTLAIRPTAATLPASLAQRHHRRKHGPAAYYGQRG
jgi:L-ribulose-5-phosphate 4-epimerase